MHDLPGGDLIERGLQDLEAGHESVESLLVTIAATRLRELGLPIRASGLPQDPELKLYRRLGEDAIEDPYSAYNAYLRRLVKFRRALEQHVARAGA